MDHDVTTELRLGSPIGADGTNRAYAWLRHDEGDAVPVALTWHVDSVELLTENGTTSVIDLAKVETTVESYSRLSIVEPGRQDGRVELEFLDSKVRHRATGAAAAAATVLAPASGIGGAAASAQANTEQHLLATRRFPGFYRHLQEHSATFTPMPWHHRHRIGKWLLLPLFAVVVPAIFFLAWIFASVSILMIPSALIAPGMENGIGLDDVVRTFLWFGVALAGTALFAGVGLELVHQIVLAAHNAFFADPAQRCENVVDELGTVEEESHFLWSFGVVRPLTIVVMAPIVAALLVAGRLVLDSGDAAASEEFDWSSPGSWLVVLAMSLSAGAVLWVSFRHVLAGRPWAGRSDYYDTYRVRSSHVSQWPNARIVLGLWILGSLAILIVGALVT